MASNLYSNDGGGMSSPSGEQAAVLALTKASPREWYRTAAVIYEAGSALNLLSGQSSPLLAEAHQRYASDLTRRVGSDDLAEAQELIDRVTSRGVRLHTVLA